MSSGGVFLIVVVLSPILWQIPRAFWPVRLDSGGSRFKSLYRRYSVQTFTGYASEIRSWQESRTMRNTMTGHVQGTVDSFGNVSGTATVRNNQRTYTLYHTAFFLTGSSGQTSSFDAINVMPSIGNGHLVSVAWLVHNRKPGPAFLVYDHTAGTWTLETHKGRGLRKNRRGLVNMVVTLPVVYAAIFVLAVPVYVLVGIGTRTQLNLFGKFGVRPLLARVQADAANMPSPHVDAPVPVIDLATQVKEITALHESGALSHEEYQAAKAKLLGT